MRLKHTVYVVLVGGVLSFPFFLEFVPFPGFHRGLAPLGYFFAALMLLATNFALFLLGLIAAGRAPHESARRNATGWMLATSITLLVFAATCTGLTTYCGGMPTGSCLQTFDSVRWKRLPAGAIPAAGQRSFMVGDLVTRVLPRLTRPQVVALLGIPGSNLCGQTTPGQFSYLVGESRNWLLGVGFECLAISFGDDERVASWVLVNND